MGSVVEDVVSPTAQRSAMLQTACMVVSAHWKLPKAGQTKEGNLQIARGAVSVIGCTLKYPPGLSALIESLPGPVGKPTAASGSAASGSADDISAAPSSAAPLPLPAVVVKKEICA